MTTYKDTFLLLRKVIGVLGVTLPLILIVGNLISKGVLCVSMSAYYYTVMRDIFVGSLFVIGFFLFAYPGYEKIDNILCNIAFFLAVGAAIFPTGQAGSVGGVKHIIHLICAGLLFLDLSYISIFLFTKTNRIITSNAKKRRNKIYLTCGIIMLTMLLAIGSTSLYPKVNANLSLTLWYETILLWCFGISWAIKGRILRMVEAPVLL